MIVHKCIFASFFLSLYWYTSKLYLTLPITNYHYDKLTNQIYHVEYFSPDEAKRRLLTILDKIDTDQDG